MNQYYYNKQNRARWMTAVAPYRPQSRMILSTYQVIEAIALFNMLKAKGYNLESPFKESGRKSKTTTRGVIPTVIPANYQILQTILS